MIDDDTTHYILDITQSHIVTLQGRCRFWKLYFMKKNNSISPRGKHDLTIF